MAKKSQINRNAKRERMVAQYASRRKALKAETENMSLPPEERFAAHLKLAKLPRNSSKTRIRNYRGSCCEICRTGARFPA